MAEIEGSVDGASCVWDSGGRGGIGGWECGRVDVSYRDGHLSSIVHGLWHDHFLKGAANMIAG